ncbi:MAG: transglutaminase-like domain-containing protein [Acidimicrobiales bacterium]
MVGLTAAATPLAANFFDGAPYGAVALVSALAVVAGCLATVRLPPAVALAAGMAAGTGVLMVVLSDAPDPGAAPRSALAPVEVARLVARGWPDLLSSAVPAERSAALLALPLALCWTAAFVTVLLVRRVRAGAVSVIPLLAVAVVLLLTGPGPASMAAATVVAGSALFHIAVRATYAGIRASGHLAQQRDSVQLGRYALRTLGLVALPAVALAVGVGGLGAGLALGEPARTDLHAPSRIEARDELTPLSQLRRQLLADPTELFTVTISGAGGTGSPPIDRLRVATLEHYDGALWTSSGVFLPVTNRVREPDTSSRTAVPVTVRVRTTPSYRSSYLPVAGLLRTVSGTALGLAEDTDTLITGVEPGTPVDLSFTAEVPVGARPTEVGPPSPAASGLDDLSGLTLPTSFPRFVDEVAGDTTDPVARLDLLEAAMQSRDGFGYSVEDAYSGHDLPVLDTYLSPAPVTPFQLNRQGYAEQSAAAFALLARMQGLPARVAVGYLLREPDKTAAGATVSVSTSDAHAWAEVFLSGEWVAFEPTDRTVRSVRSLSPEQVTDTGRAEQAEQPPLVPPPAPTAVVVPDAPPWRLIAGAAALVIVVALPATAKLVRSRLRRRGDPARRVLGAWRELRDRLRDRGAPLTRSTTPRDLRTGAADRPGVSGAWLAELDELARLHDRALFAPDGADAEAGRRAWQLVPRLARDSGFGRSLPRRLLGRLDPRSLRRPPPGRVRPTGNGPDLRPDDTSAPPPLTQIDTGPGERRPALAGRG